LGSSYTANSSNVVHCSRADSKPSVSHEPWLNDVPKRSLSAEEQVFVDELRMRLSLGEKPSVHRLRQDYQALTGRPATRARIMKLLNKNSQDGTQPECFDGMNK